MESSFTQAGASIMTAIIAKCIVLSFAIIAGALSIYLGYDLYIRGVTLTSDAGGNFQSYSFWLRGAGPGIFFALFGFGIIAVASTRKFQQTQIKAPYPSALARSTYCAASSGADLPGAPPASALQPRSPSTPSAPPERS
jgi:hypothetical protein